MTTTKTEPVPAPEAAEETGRAPVGGLPFWANPRLGLLVVLAALVVIFSSIRPAFLNVQLTLEVTNNQGINSSLAYIVNPTVF